MPLHLKIKDRFFYGWVVVTACSIIGTLLFAARFSFGIFFKSLESEFALSRTFTSSIFSAYMVLGAVFAVLGGWALDRYGPRAVTFVMGLFAGLSLLLTSQVNSSWQFFITYSLLLAIGSGATYTVIIVTTARWFNRKRGIALGISGSSEGLGTVVIAPFATYLISSFNWQVAYIVIGAITGLFIISLSMLLKKDPAEIGLLPDGVKSDSSVTVVAGNKDSARLISFSLTRAFRTRNFWSLLMVWALFSLCLHLVITHLVPHITDMDISATEAAAVLSLMGGFSVLGRLVTGWVSDRMDRKLAAVYCSLPQAGAMLWLAWSHDTWMFYLFAVVYGFFTGGLSTPTALLVSDYFGDRDLGTIMGALAVGWGVGAAIGPAVGGLIFDASNSYFAAFLIGALAMLVATLFLALTRRETSRDIHSL